MIELGKYKLKFVGEAAAPAAGAADFEKTMVLRPGAMKAMMAAAPAAAAPSAAAPAPAAAAAPGAAPAAKSFGDTMVNQGALATPKPAAAPAAAPAGPAPAPAQKRGALKILSGTIAGRELELTKPLTTLGKPGVQVAVITRRPQGFFVTHVEGTTFPVVNGKTLDAQAHVLNDHDIIELAGVKMEFFFKA